MSSRTAQIPVFIDTEFTHLCDALNPEPAVLISIGAVTQNGEQHFYAENAQTQPELCSDFTTETVRRSSRATLQKGNGCLLEFRGVWYIFTDEIGSE